MAATAETMSFVYKGKNRKGEKVEGELRAGNLSMAKGLLRKQGIISTSLKKNLILYLAAKRRKSLRQILPCSLVSWRQ